MTPKTHWDSAYQAKGSDDVSWFQARPETSLAMIRATGAPLAGGVIDVGGGAAGLVDCLLDEGYSALAVLDVSGAALEIARARLGARADEVEWFEADVTTFQPPRRFAIWHDRAVFHFLTTPAQRCAYLATLRRTLQPSGHVIIATFAPDGPQKCSGLEVVRYDENSLAAELGPEFVLRDSRRELHQTPWGSEQAFVWCWFGFGVGA